MTIQSGMEGFNTRLVLLIILTAGIGGGSGSFINSKINPPRPDPFYGSQAEDLAKSMKVFVVAAIELQERETLITLREVELSIRNDMPPEHTKQRIRSIENYLAKNGKYEPPSYKWHD